MNAPFTLLRPRVLLTLAFLFVGGACAPIDRPDHCSNQSSEGPPPCNQGEICTTSLCAGLGPIVQDNGCRAQEDVFAAAQAAMEHGTFGQFSTCLRRVGAEQERVLDRIEQGQDVGLGPQGPEPSLGPESNCPDPNQGEGAGQPGTSTLDYCVQDADCVGSAKGPHCDPKRGTCHPCVPGQDHCLDPLKPICDEHLGELSCQACSVDMDCIALGRGAHCRKRIVDGQYEPRCEACAQDFHCAQVPGRPFCDSAADEMLPRCVACTQDEHCGSSFQSCQDHQCVGCRSDEECHTGSSCWSWPESPGLCSPRVYYVDSGGNADCLTGNGTPARPFCRLNEAVAKLRSGELTTIRVKGLHRLHRGLVLPAGTKLQLVGDGLSQVEIDEAGQGLLTMSGNSQLRVSGLELRSRQSHVLLCRGPKSQLRLEDVRVQAGSSSTLVIQGCEVQVHRSHLEGSQGYALVAKDARIVMGSSIVAGNGRIDHDLGGGFRLDGKVFLELEHMTIASNHAKSQPAVIKCQGSENQIFVRDSIVARLDSKRATDCAERTTFAQRNWSDETIFSTGAGRFVENAQVLYALVRSPLTYDFRLMDPLMHDSTSAEIASLGQWSPGDGPFDIEGQRWSAGAGFVGADQSSFAELIEGLHRPNTLGKGDLGAGHKVRGGPLKLGDSDLSK